MLRYREGSVALTLFIVLPSCSLLIDKNPDGIIKDGSAGNGTVRTTNSMAGAASGGAVASSIPKSSAGGGGTASSWSTGVAGATVGGVAGATQSAASTGGATGGDTSSGGTLPGGTTAIATAGGGAQGGTSTTVVATQCTIASTAYATGATNPANTCQVCDPLRSVSEWSPGSEGKTCGTGQVCHQGACTNGCWINSKFYEVGAANPDDSCMYCQSSSPNGWVLASPCVTRIFAPGAKSCETLRDGSTFCWGFFSYDATRIRATPEPVRMPPTAPVVTQISGSGSYTCALSGTDMYCWGYSEEGIYGFPTSGSDTSDTPIKTPVTGVLEIASAHYVNCVRLASGVQCAGAAAQAGSYGVLGDGTTTQGRGTYEVVSDLGSVTNLAAGYAHACAVSDGSVWCWGRNAAGELGDNSTELRATPVKVQNLASVNLLSAGGTHTCGVSLGSVYCWGSNNSGQLGNNSASDSLVPVQVVGIDTSVTRIDAGGSHACAIAAGKLYCWGSNAYGQLGDGTKDTHLVATPVPGFSVGVTDVACGDSHTCAIKNGVAYCWGWNNYGQLGTGTSNGTADDYSMVPVPVADP